MVSSQFIPPLLASRSDRRRMTSAVRTKFPSVAPALSNRIFLVLACLTAVLCLLLSWSAGRPPREWQAGEVPVAFWSWQSNAPSKASLERAIDQAGARVLFMRAGQIDYDSGTVRRIRPVTGALPKGIELYLVYNATSDLLTHFENIDPEVLASAICITYAADLTRTSAEGAHSSGVQLDLDVPTRLLPRYKQVLSVMRRRLPGGTTLSITGLPTWMTSPALAGTLDEVDFWIPQCYGGVIPARLDHAEPISSQGEVVSAIERARRLGKPFYAGLAAYGYAIHFDRAGRRVEVSGSLDPEIVANEPSLGRVECSRFDSDLLGDWRYVYLARETCKAGELLIRKGERLMLDLPTSEALREAASSVRKRGGERLLGICVFRLPTAGDATTLTVEEIAAALSNQAPAAAIEIRASTRREEGNPDRPIVEIKWANTGAIRGLAVEDAVRVIVNLEGAPLRSLASNGFASSELLFVPSGASGDDPRQTPVACGVARANVVRLSKRAWSPGMSASVILKLEAPPPDTIPVTVTVRLDQTHTLKETRLVTIERIPDSE